MRKSILASYFLLLTLFSCDTTRLYEENRDLEQTQWLYRDTVTFEFRVRDLGKRYNLLCNVRNTSDYPYARLFINYTLKDSTGSELTKDMTSVFLFDAKTGKPFGTSGVGDVFDHRIPLLSNHQFLFTGKYTLEFEQRMRLDTLNGIRAVGYRLEEVINNQK